MKVFLICLAVVFNSFAITVSQSTAGQLVYNLIGNNVIIANGIVSCSDSTAGLYQDNNIMAGNMAELFHGVVLSTGNVFSLNTNENTGSSSTLIGLPGDEDLELLIDNNENSYDATYIEFDFIPMVTGTMYLSYQFASEEYYFNYDPQYELYHDVFAVFLDGDNIATLPNGQNISINTVNQYENTEYFNGNYYNDIATEVNGFTDGFLFNKQVVEGQTYHIKLGITDIRDPHYDSYVFFGKNSLWVESSDPNDDGLLKGIQSGLNVPDEGTYIPLLMGFFLIFGILIKNKKKC